MTGTKEQASLSGEAVFDKALLSDKAYEKWETALEEADRLRVEWNCARYSVKYNGAKLEKEAKAYTKWQKAMRAAYELRLKLEALN